MTDEKFNVSRDRAVREIVNLVTMAGTGYNRYETLESAVRLAYLRGYNDATEHQLAIREENALSTENLLSRLERAMG